MRHVNRPDLDTPENTPQYRALERRDVARTAQFPIWKQFPEGLLPLRQNLERLLSTEKDEARRDILSSNLHMVEWLSTAGTIRFRLTERNYRSLLDSVDGDVFALLEQYGVEWEDESEVGVRLHA
jgi:hypothetical protein